MDNFSISDIFETKTDTLSDVLFGSEPVKQYEEIYDDAKLLDTHSKLLNLFK